MAKQTQVLLSGLSCSACEKMVQKKIGKIDGVTGVQVDVSTGNTTIEAERQISDSEISKALEGTHYTLVNKS